MSFGSAGRALAFAELDLAKLEELRSRSSPGRSDQRPPLGSGDQNLARRAQPTVMPLSSTCAPSLIAREANASSSGAAQERARSTLMPRRASSRRSRRGLSLDPAATVFQIGGILADVAARLP